MSTKTQDLLSKYFSGSCTPKELRTIEGWANESTVNQIELRKLEKIWFSTDQSNFDPDIDKAWNRVNELTGGTQLNVTHRGFSSTTRWISGIAASIALIAVTWVYVANSSSNWKYISSSDQRIEYELPDGSRVWLKENSKLGFNYTDDERATELTGEGFFDVKRNVNLPFSIALQNSQIQVLGTSFYAKSLINGDDQVSVKSGTVSFTDTDDDKKKVVLKAGEEAILEIVSNNMIRQNIVNLNVMAWQTGIMVFNKTPLKKVCKELTNYYKIEISLENMSLGNCLITSKFDNQSIEEVLGVIKKLLSAELKRTEKGYLLSGQGC